MPRLKAFTLIELLIVITIIGILSVALIPRITGGPAKARDTSRKSDLQGIASALELYASDNQGAYPVHASVFGCVNDTNLARGITDELAPYMTEVPIDPTDNSWRNGSACAVGDYVYIQSSKGYFLIAEMENADMTGEGVYSDGIAGFDPWELTNPTSLSTTKATLDANAGESCDVTNCSTSGAIYILAR